MCWPYRPPWLLSASVLADTPSPRGSGAGPTDRGCVVGGLYTGRCLSAPPPRVLPVEQQVLSALSPPFFRSRTVALATFLSHDRVRDDLLGEAEPLVGHRQGGAIHIPSITWIRVDSVHPRLSCQCQSAVVTRLRPALWAIRAGTSAAPQA